MLRFLTSGERGGRQQAAILEGMVAGLAIDARAIGRACGFKKGRIEIISGVRAKKSIGGAIAFAIPGACEAAAHAAVGAICRNFLEEFDVDFISRTASKGGIFEIRVKGVPAGLGSFVQYDRRLSARLCAALMAVPGVRSVEMGLGFKVSETPGSEAHDEIFYDKKKGFYRKTNHAGGFEGGMTNGEDLVLRAAIKSGKRSAADCEAAGEAMVAFELAKAYLEKFGGDSLGETKRNFNGYLKQIKAF